MTRRIWGLFQPGVGRWVARVSWARMALAAEMVVLLVLAVALTVAPQITLSAIASTVAQARDFSLSYRPATALVGLMLTALIAQGLRTWFGRPGSASREPQALEYRAEEPSRSGMRGPTQRAA